MNCPRCKISLTAGSYEGEQAEHCSSCGGILIKQKSLTGILKRLTKDLFEHVNMHTEIPTVSDRGQVDGCPDCGSPMDYYGYMDSKSVLIDYCNHCKSLWIDALEIAAMAKMYAVSGKYQQYLRYSRYKGVDILGAYAYSQAVSGAFLLGFSIGRIS